MSDAPAAVSIAPSRHRLRTEIDGHYLLVPASTPGGDAAAAAPLLVGCHGYGENAGRHLAELRRIPGAERWHLCAVEALHRFYNTKSGEVVGSWMTKEDRESAIAGNLRYVGAVIDAVGRELEVALPLVFSGFSQGVAMAYRAAVGSGHDCAGLIVLAGDVPPDVPELAAASGRRLPPVLVGRGRDDDWYTAAKMAADLEVLAAHGVEVETCVFDGGHVWSEAFRDAAGSFLGRLSATR